MSGRVSGDGGGSVGGGSDRRGADAAVRGDVLLRVQPGEAVAAAQSGRVLTRQRNGLTSGQRSEKDRDISLKTRLFVRLESYIGQYRPRQKITISLISDFLIMNITLIKGILYPGAKFGAKSSAKDWTEEKETRAESVSRASSYL